MRRLLPFAFALAALAPLPLSAQSSQFGIRGLGYPNSPYSSRVRAMGGGASLFDPESGTNPASLVYLTEMTAGFSVLSDRRTVDGPEGSAALRGMRFPLFSISSPFRTVPIAISIGFSTYMARDFSVAFRDTIVVRGIPTETIDTLASSGGLNDLRLAVGWRLDPKLAVGGAFHIYTGVQRIRRARHFQDSGYVSISESSEVSAAGVGFDVGAVRRMSNRLTIAGDVRIDGHLRVRRDSLVSTEFPVDLPITLMFGAQYRPTPKLQLAAQGRWQGWGSANTDLTSVGGTGARDTWEVGFGGEYTRHLDRPSRYPIRFGVRHTGLPFPLLTGGKPAESAVSLGTGFLFKEGMGGIDGSLERVWRAEGTTFTEKAWLLSLTATLRPNRRVR